MLCYRLPSCAGCTGSLFGRLSHFPTSLWYPVFCFFGFSYCFFFYCFVVYTCSFESQNIFRVFLAFFLRSPLHSSSCPGRLLLFGWFLERPPHLAQSLLVLGFGPYSRTRIPLAVCPPTDLSPTLTTAPKFVSHATCLNFNNTDFSPEGH